MHSNTNPRCFRRTRIFLVAFALVLLSSVCVGAVSGAVFEVSSEQQLINAVNQANGNNEADIIIITHDIARSTNTPITITSQITLTGSVNKDVTITAVDQSSITSLFKVDGGSLVLSSGTSGSLTINGGTHMISPPGGGAVYVTNGGSLVMNDRVTITNFGFLGGAVGDIFDWSAIVYNGAGIYVDNGSFTMNGGTISKCNANLGGAVYISSSGSCTINDGLITLNGHKYTLGSFIILHQSEGGAVYVADGGTYVQKKEESEIYVDNKGKPANVRYSEQVVTVTYKVLHYLQNLDLNTYSLADTEEVKGTVGHSTAADVGDYPGFTAEEFSQETIERANTIVEIHYNRDTTTITWVVDDTKYHEYSGVYGSAVTHPPSIPTKTGYHFSGWNPAVPETMPADDLIVEAIWDAGITYTIIIPDSFSLMDTGDGFTGSMIVTATQMWIPTEDSLVLTVRSLHGFTLQLSDFTSYCVPYTLTVEGESAPLSNDSEVAVFTMEEYQQQGSNELSVTLDATLASTPKYSGEYFDSLTFTVTYVGNGVITS